MESVKCYRRWRGSTNIVPYTGGIKRKTNQLSIKALKWAALDCACSSTACGKKWFNDYITILSDTRDKT